MSRYQTGGFSDFIEDVVKGAVKGAVTYSERNDKKDDKKEVKKDDKKEEKRSFLDDVVDSAKAKATDAVAKKTKDNLTTLIGWGIVVYVLLKGSR